MHVHAYVDTVVGYNVPSHCLGCTHSFLSQSITVPVGHWHPLTTQIRGQGTGPVLLHARWQLGSKAHSTLICPLIGQAKNEEILNTLHRIFVHDTIN